MAEGADPKRTRARTRFAEARLAAGWSQRQLALRIGGDAAATLRQIQRVEHGGTRSPSIRLLTNCALAMGCSLEELCEPEWLQWSGATRAPRGRQTVRLTRR